MADLKDNVNETPHFTYIWTIENMCLPCFVESPTFIVKQMEITRWNLMIQDNSDCIEIDILRMVDYGPKALEIKFELSFLGCDGLSLIEEEGIKKFQTDDIYTFEKFANINEVFFEKRAKFLPKDELTIRCRMWRTGTDIEQIDSCFARTRLSPGQQSFVWAIRDFITHQRDHEKNLVLHNCPRNEVTFNLHVTENDGKEYISISTKGCDYECLVLKISLLDFQGKIVHAVKKIGHSDKGVQFEKFFEKRELMKNALSLLRNDVLLLRCEIEMVAKIVWSKIENYINLNSKNFPVFVCDEEEILNSVPDGPSIVTFPYKEGMKILCENGCLSDVSLRTGSKLFPVHKSVLSARSPVFEEIFKGDMNTSKCIEIPNVDAQTLEDLLSYIYADTVGDLDWSRAVDLYRAADEYKVLDLKRRCATFLMSDLSVSSVCAVFRVADFPQNTELREAAQDFVLEQGTE